MVFVLSGSVLFVSSVVVCCVLAGLVARWCENAGRQRCWRYTEVAPYALLKSMKLRDLARRGDNSMQMQGLAVKKNASREGGVGRSFIREKYTKSYFKVKVNFYPLESEG